MKRKKRVLKHNLIYLRRNSLRRYEAGRGREKGRQAGIKFSFFFFNLFFHTRRTIITWKLAVGAVMKIDLHA